MKLVALFAMMLLITCSCGRKVDKNDPLSVEVWAIHDEVMPKLSTMHKLKKELRKSADSDSPQVKQMITNLSKAHEGMIDWMANFSPPEDASAKKLYLESQLVSVKKMASDINNAIEQSQSHLENKK